MRMCVPVTLAWRKNCKSIMASWPIFGLVVNLTPYECHFPAAIGCPFEWCTAHTMCPPGKYMSKPGSSTAQATCETCAPGFFKATTSKSTTCAEEDSGRPYSDRENIRNDDFVKSQN